MNPVDYRSLFGRKFSMPNSRSKKARRASKAKVSSDIMARDFLGLAQEEKRVAQYEETVGFRESNVYARNKALQSAGMAVELAYKALILGQRKTPIGSGRKGHRIEVLHRQVTGKDKLELERGIGEVGWPDAAAWCRYLDETVIATKVPHVRPAEATGRSVVPDSRPR